MTGKKAKPVGPPDKGRVSTQMRKVIELMATKGYDEKTAAEIAGMNLEACRRALQRPHVKRALNQAIADIRQNASQQAYLRINDISQHGDSERLRFDASRWVAGVDGIAPVQKVAAQVNHRHEFGGYDYDGMTDVTPSEDHGSPTDAPQVADNTPKKDER